jgi:SAM-dependent methyltransferase
MSYRLAQRGHRPVAVDLFENEQDGLGAARHYLAFVRDKFPRLLAEMDRLPFAGSQFDLVVFNASCHYSEDYEITLKEALRCLRRPGHILIMDSPFYCTEAGGIAMVREKHARFQKKFGFRSDTIAAREFFTGDLLNGLSGRTGIRWEIHKPWYGLGWALRPLRARLSGRREPAKFYMALGSVDKS